MKDWQEIRKLTNMHGLVINNDSEQEDIEKVVTTWMCYSSVVVVKQQQNVRIKNSKNITNCE